MSEIKVVEGELFIDYRGEIMSVNNLDFAEIKRSYVITNTDTEIIRGWHGHQDEKKWFWCVKGSFKGAFVEVDNWKCPSKNLIPHFFELRADHSQVVCVPEGYANCLRATKPDSKLIVFSSKTYPECLSDSWRYEPNYWFDWDEIK